MKIREEKDLRKVRPTQTHGWAEAAETHIMSMLHSDLIAFFCFLKWKLFSNNRGFRMLKTLRKTMRSFWALFIWGPLLTVCKTFWTIQHIYSSWWRLLWIKIKQLLILLCFFISHSTPVLELHSQTLYLWICRPWNLTENELNWVWYILFSRPVQLVIHFQYPSWNCPICFSTLYEFSWIVSTAFTIMQLQAVIRDP
jgi:hypothetical protein